MGKDKKLQKGLNNLESHYDLAAYFQTGVKSEVKRMVAKYGSEAVLTGIEAYITEKQGETTYE